MAYRTAESEVARTRKRRETFLYVPRPRGCLSWVLDVIVVIATVALILLTARKQVVTCDWPESKLAQCVVHTENAAGIEADYTISGIHGFAYRTGLEVGFVTDAKNKDRDAAFGTRAIVTKEDASTDALASFAINHLEHVVVEHGPEHPLRVTGLYLLGLMIYLAVTRRAAYAITVDRGERMLFISPRGWFGETKRVELADVRKVETENADVGKHRVRIALKSGGYLPITPDFSSGAHHLAIATEVTDALSA